MKMLKQILYCFSNACFICVGVYGIDRVFFTVPSVDHFAGMLMGSWTGGMTMLNWYKVGDNEK